MIFSWAQVLWFIIVVCALGAGTLWIYLNL